jgi:hypothetical protein
VWVSEITDVGTGSQRKLGFLVGKEKLIKHDMFKNSQKVQLIALDTDAIKDTELESRRSGVMRQGPKFF